MTGYIVQSDAAAIPLQARWFHTVITSPPYYSLRSYEGEQKRHWPYMDYRMMPGTPPLEIPAWDGPLGAEPTPWMYVAHLVLVARQVARVMRPDGVFWLNLGDSFAGSGGLCTVPSLNNRGLRMEGYRSGFRDFDKARDGIGPLDLLAIPYRAMFALQADGWIVRNDLIWSKDATMPEPRKGWRWETPPCDCNKAEREALVDEQMERTGAARHRIGYGSSGKPGDLPFKADCPKCQGTGRVIGNPVLREGSWRHTRAHELVLMLTRQGGYYSNHLAVAEGENHANPRDVLRPSRSTYSGEHFAVFPPELIAPLIMATTPRDCCGACGKGYAPIVEDGRAVGTAQTCDCDGHDPRPGRVLDPFFGSGTTGVVCRELGLDFVGLDISHHYLETQAKPRALRQTPKGALDDLPLFGGGQDG
jgi:DNA modification methylase